MNKRPDIQMTIPSAAAVSLLAASATAALLTLYYRHRSFQLLGGLCERIVRECPASRQSILRALKTPDPYTTDACLLTAFGYHPSDLGLADTAVLWIALFGSLAGIMLFLFSSWRQHRRTAARIQALTDYLEKINTGGQGSLIDATEDGFSKLQDEIYKTVTALYQTRGSALAARNDLAENLSNIAHQIKTPITSISLSIQMEKERLGAARLQEIQRQLDRLTHLEEALSLLSRIDAGVLVLERKPVDIFTLLTLASDNLYTLFAQKNVLLHIPELGEIEITADLDWTMEAVMNLMKDCLEAVPPGAAVYCSYEQHPLYVQIRIWDEGEGFAREDLPYLFDRFYRGRRPKGAGIGIGLSLSKAIIEMQNGIIRAFNLPLGGACFEIRFYS